MLFYSCFYSLFLISIIIMLRLNQIHLWDLKTKKIANLSYTVSSIGTSTARYFQFLPPSYRHLYTHKNQYTYVYSYYVYQERRSFAPLCVWETISQCKTGRLVHPSRRRRMRVHCTTIKNSLHSFSCSRIRINKHQRRSFNCVLFTPLFHL